MDFDDVLAEAEQEPATDVTVQVCVKPSVAKKMAVLLARLDTAIAEDARDSAIPEQRLAAPDPAPVTRRQDAVQAEIDDLQDEVDKSLITLRFTRLDGEKWADLTSANPMRLGVALDRHYGYNFDAVSVAAAQMSGVRVDEDGDHELTDEQWERLLKLLSGYDRKLIRDAVWTLNEYGPQQLVDALVKGSGAA